MFWYFNNLLYKLNHVALCCLLIISISIVVVPYYMMSCYVVSYCFASRSYSNWFWVSVKKISHKAEWIICAAVMLQLSITIKLHIRIYFNFLFILLSTVFCFHLVDITLSKCPISCSNLFRISRSVPPCSSMSSRTFIYTLLICRTSDFTSSLLMLWR